MKLLPSSLAARTVLLVVAVVAVAEFATFSLIFGHERATHMKQTAQFVAGQERLLQTVLPGLNSEARQRLEDSDVGEQWLQLRPDGDSVPTHEPVFGFAHGLAKDLGHILGEKVILRDVGPRPRSGLWIGFMAGGERWWLVLPPPRFEPQRLPPDLWSRLAVTLAVLVLIAGLFVRGIVGPLARLGEAVTATGGGSARTVTPEGPKEVRRLAERHNTMLAQLAWADAERREMLAGLTHDLRAPLARLRVRLALLENDAERAGLTRDTDDMERIVSHCLAFLRSEENSTLPAPPLTISDAVSNEVARHRELGRPVEMAVGEAAAACQVAIDHGNLQRLLDNLIDNALQYGAPPVEISLSVERPETITLRVRDHGPGIAAGQREHALEAFAQIDPARATRGNCGLGLAIVRRIVTGCGGKVTLGDAPGGGLEVVLSFPVQSG
jgi:two-component system osmolarity sensor histidine kinase EnvZ